jgi:hypothetical protein
VTILQKSVLNITVIELFLKVGLTSLRIRVEPLPRGIIAAAQLKNKRDKESQKNTSGDTQSLNALKGFIIIK